MYVLFPLFIWCGDTKTDYESPLIAIWVKDTEDLGLSVARLRLRRHAVTLCLRLGM